MTIVIADGNHVVANSYNNPDLFWALRGGGGGTWGFITSVTYRTHPSTPFSAAFLLVNSTNPTSTKNLLTEIIRLTPSLVEDCYGGYSGGLSTSCNSSSYLPTPRRKKPRLLLIRSSTSHSHKRAYRSKTTPLCSKISGNSMTPSGTRMVKSAPRQISSWLLPEEVVKADKPEQLAAELLRTSGFGYLRVFVFTSREAERIPENRFFSH